MNKLTIGQMAQLNHVSEQTLRYYDKLGLLKPNEVDKETGYRYYSIKQSARLDMIQYMKSLGMSLKDIKEQLNNCDIGLIKSILEQKSKQIDEQIEALKFQKRAVERAIISYERYETSPPDGTIVLEFIGKRKVYSYETEINFYEYGLEAYEEILRNLKQDLKNKGLPQIYFCNAGNIVSQENIMERKFISSEIFVFVDREYVPAQLIKTIPANIYLCIYCNKFDKEISYAYRLLDEIEKCNYTIAGDYICEVIADLPDYDDNERGMFFRLQVPVKID
ncbi:MAG: MerR family transcriptional regulator [Lutispora sp.]|mgnify:FL=1|nr:MerR family transcriptional regulator [Clostridiales bacterium]